MISGDYAESLEGYLNTSMTLYREELQRRNISMGKTVQFVRPALCNDILREQLRSYDVSRPRTIKTGGAKVPHGERQTGRDHHQDRFLPGKVRSKEKLTSLLVPCRPSNPTSSSSSLCCVVSLVRWWSERSMINSCCWTEPFWTRWPSPRNMHSGTRWSYQRSHLFSKCDSNDWELRNC